MTGVSSGIDAITDLRAGDVDRAAATLAGGFGDDPAFAFTIGNDGGNAERIEPFFRVMLRAGLDDDHALTHLGPDAAAVARWKVPGQWKDPISEQLRTAPSMIRIMRWRIVLGFRMFSAIEKVHPEEPHYYLQFLATHPRHQSKGLGGAVLTPMLERCDTEGVPAYLESSNPRNVPFYARHGFVERDPVPLPDGWPTITPMWRDPR